MDSAINLRSKLAGFDDHWAPKVIAEGECHVLLVEPRGVVNTGDAGGPRTAEHDVWI